jgi:YD repeat-containing protein
VLRDDPLNRLTRAVTTKAVNAAPTIDCPDATHPTTMVDSAFGTTGYDASYTYDDLGNMTSATTAMAGGRLAVFLRPTGTSRMLFCEPSM